MKNCVIVLLLSFFCIGACPSRTQSYVAGQVIDPNDVQENEDNLYTALCTGNFNLSNSSVTSAIVVDGTITTSDVASETLTTSNILNGTLLDADVSTSAAIAYSKLNLSGAILNADVSTSAAIAYSKLSLGNSIVTGDVTDNTLTPSDFAATLTFADGDLVSLASINASSATEGLLLPQSTSCASATAEGQVCWNTDLDALSVGSGTVAQVGQLVKAWVNFDLSGGTPSVQDSFNVTSISDNGTGDFTVNFTVAFVNTGFACTAMSDSVHAVTSALTAGTIRIQFTDATDTLQDSGDYMVLCVGDL